MSKLDIPTDPVARAEEFESAFNRIDNHLRKVTGKFDKGLAMSAVIHEYEQLKPGMATQMRDLRAYSDLRNALVHERRQRHVYIAYPSEETLAAILQLERRITAPLRVEQKFLQNVISVSPTDSLKTVLAHIRQHEFTQFPVYNDNNKFVGLVTANGLAHWLASYPGDEPGIIEWEQHSVADILAFEEQRNHVEFVARKTLVVDVLKRYQDNSALEAVIITHHGKRNEQPLGIVTPWDLAAIDWEQL